MTLQELVAQELERFKKLDLIEYLGGTLEDVRFDVLDSFLKDFALTIARATEKAGDVEKSTANDVEDVWFNAGWNANNADRRRRMREWFGEI